MRQFNRICYKFSQFLDTKNSSSKIKQNYRVYSVRRATTDCCKNIVTTYENNKKVTSFYQMLRFWFLTSILDSDWRRFNRTGSERLWRRKSAHSHFPVTFEQHRHHSNTNGRSSLCTASNAWRHRGYSRHLSRSIFV